VALRPFPRETIPGAVLDYASVTLDDGTRLRTIVSVPDAQSRRFPALLLLQGGGCGSVDVPMAPAVGPAGLMRTIATQSFVTMRVELSGVGDSQGPPCDTIGYRQELAGYRAALAALKRHPRVDPDRIVLLGLSLGGAFAPTLAREQPVRGIIVFGTLATPPSPYPGRSEQFFREFASVDVAADWAAIDARVLILHGEFDENTTSAEHALRIAAIVNGRHRGAAVRREFEGLDHCWTRQASMEQSRGHCGTGAATTAVDDAILEFLGSIR
jgi:dienelactone hydrolase